MESAEKQPTPPTDAGVATGENTPSAKRPQATQATEQATPEYVEFSFAQIYVEDREKQILMKEKVKNTLDALYKDYVRLQKNISNDSRTKKGVSSSSGTTPMIIDDEEKDADLEMDFQRHLEAEETKENKSEIDIYLSDGVERGVNEDFDVLLWWKTNSTKFPILSCVASESAFSTGGRVIDPFRSSLTPKTAEALICAQDWLRSKPTDLETPLGVIEEIRQKLEEVELDEFSKGPKYLLQVIMEE